MSQLASSNTTGRSSRDPVLLEKCLNTDTKTHSRSNISVPSKSASVFVDLTLSSEQHTIPVSTSLYALPCCQLQSSASSETSTVSPSSVLSYPTVRSLSPLDLPSLTTNFQAPIARSATGLSLSMSQSSSGADRRNVPGTVHVKTPLETQDDDEIMSIIKMIPRSGMGAIIPVQGKGMHSNQGLCRNVTVIPTDLKRNIALTDPRLRRIKNADIAESFEQKEVHFETANNYHNFTKLFIKRHPSNETEGKPRCAINIQSLSDQPITHLGQSMDFSSTAPKQCTLELKSNDFPNANMSSLYKDLLYAGRSKENSDIMDCKESASAKMPLGGMNNPAPRKSPQCDSVELYTNCVVVQESPAVLNEIHNNVLKLPEVGVLSTDNQSGSLTVQVNTEISSEDNNGMSSENNKGISSANEMKQFLNHRLDKKIAKPFPTCKLSMGENYLQKGKMHELFG